MANLNQYQCFFFYSWAVFTHMWAAYPATGRVFTVLINKLTLNDDNFFAAPVCVWLEHFDFRPEHKCGTLGVVVV